ncbi:electron transfer flavoprotein subunit alpha/FixB family protein [Desulfobotulus mexicanus]|uniref:Electron transfer flavoprotein subunit alpha/FixB family protein n=1 Tax=Desulfobotulus mexicanus TaxID=2586642 RepID=A0A5Q4VDX7_9BACT|nr:electron transfer flavoprotein subunit alpha/FixB family protein [Desulfobotulus mexicanus]TYT75899.1 electron transfer flavoprotein subunit alpha/FixB family protein [Desulfobotulus mexicanus]
MTRLDIVLGRGDIFSLGAELMGLAGLLVGEDEGKRIRFLLPFGGEAHQIRDLALLGVEVQIFQYSGEKHFSAEYGQKVLNSFWKAEKPDFILMPDAGIWRSVAPALAFQSDAAYIPALRALEKDAHGMLLGRQTWSGRRMLWMRLHKKSAVLTVSPGSFTPAEKKDIPGKTEVFQAAQVGASIPFLGEEPGAVAAGLREARIVLAAGRGVEGSSQMDLIGRFGRYLPGSILAGSRPVCDGGMLPYDRQIGETGADVAPELYVAFGISGASQHLAGMGRSGFVVAVNKEKTAPFFQHADLGIVEDLEVFLEAILKIMDTEKA